MLKFEKRYDFNDIGSRGWINMALAKAASGDFKGGAEMLEAGSSLYIDDVEGVRMQSDAVALRIQQYDQDHDIRTLLDALRETATVLIAASVPRRSQKSANQEAEAHFNKGLILEELGLHASAIESYRRSAEQSEDDTWKKEAARRITLLSETPRQQRWLETRERLEIASRKGDVRAVRDIVRLFPERARAAVEKEFLPHWARNALVGDVGEATQGLAAGRAIGVALRDSLADSLLADVVLVIDESIRKKDTGRIEGLIRGFLLYEQADTAATFEKAAEELQAANSPMAHVARFFAIVAQSDVSHVDQTIARLELLKRDIPAGHRILRAMVDEAIGNCLAEGGDPDRALLLYTSALQVLETCGEPESVARMRASAAHMLALMGHPVEAWRMRRPALRVADASGDPALMEFVLTRTASDERFNREEPRALALYGSVLPLPPLYAPSASGFRMNVWRNPAPFPSSQVMLDSVNGRPLRADVQNDLRFAQGISLCQRKPEAAEKLLSESIAFAEATGRVTTLPYVYFYRAIARREAKREDAAISDLSRAISLLETRRRSMSRPDLRDLWYRIADDAFHELMNMHWERGDDRAVFAAGERRRGLVFLDGITAATSAVESLTAQQIADRLEPGTALIVFTASPRYTLATAIEKNHVEMHRLLVPTGYLLDLKRKLRSAIAEDRLSGIDAIAGQLYELLIQPLRISSEHIKKIIVIPDQPLHDVPFAILRDPKSARYLIEDFELERVASASVFAQTKQTVLAPPRTVVAVGDPAFDRNAYPALPLLPAARAEAVAVARQYPQSCVLIGQKATFETLTTSVRTADVVHIAAHTTPSRGERQVMELVLAPSRHHASTCGVGDVAGLPLKKGSIVVVAGCQTGTSREPGTLRDFAGAFLAAGASNVVATLWDVEDDPSRTFALLFHRALRRSGAAVTAMREVQLSMMRSSNPGLRNPRAWSGFQVYGVGSPR